MTTEYRLSSNDLTLAYEKAVIIEDLDLEIPDGQITTIIGPNGCGKSTLLRALVRLMKPSHGTVHLDGQLIHRLPTREVAKRLGLLQQQPTPPDGITVEDLARRGRYPHQSFLQPPSARDAEAVDRALELTGISELRKRPVDQLSGGQRQRAWIAMALAQETPLLLLDEPTTFLDIAHQMEVLDLVQQLNRDEQRTIVMVLHDINEAARASHHIVAMRAGKILRRGTPAEIVTPDFLRELYGVESEVFEHPRLGHPICLPRSNLAAPPCVSDNGHTGPGVEASHLRTGYGKLIVSDDVSVELPAGKVTCIVGPNACGKSTLLRSIGRLLKPLHGETEIGGESTQQGSRRGFARRLTTLTQGPLPPAGFLVEDLVAAGRFPYQSLWRQWSGDDETTVEGAIERCGLDELRFRELESLSGGQRQRAWIAMALAQDTPVMFLDEPTTFLDVAHQIELLDLVQELNRVQGKTVVMVLHDLVLASRYADYLVVMKDGRIVAEGAPSGIVTPDLVRRVFGIECDVIMDELTGAPVVIPASTVSDETVAEQLTPAAVGA